MTFHAQEIQFEKQYPHCDLTSILAKIRSILDLGHLDLEAEFRKGDPLNRGVIPPFMFRSALMGAAKGLRVTYDDMLFLTEMCTAKDIGLVDYRAFMDLLYKEGKARKPKQFLEENLYYHHTLESDPLNVYRDAYIKHIMDEVNARLIALGYTFDSVFVTHPGLQHTKHLIHANMLFSVLHKLGVYIQEKDYDAIVSRYQVGGMFLHKKTLFRDFKKSELSLTDKHFKRLGGDKIMRIMKVPDFPRTPRIEGEGLGLQNDLNVVTDPIFITDIHKTMKDDIPTIISRIQKYIYLRSFSPAIYFKVYDKDNDGKIERIQFFKALDDMGVTMTRPGLHNVVLRKDEMEDLADAYCPFGKPDKVHWRRFVEDLQYVYAPRELEKKPYLAPYLRPNYDPADTVRSLDNRLYFGHSLTKPEYETMENVLIKLRTQMEEQHIKLDQFFRGYDKLNRGYIERAQFVRALSNVGFHLTYDEANLFIKLFADAQGFRYPRFLKTLYENAYQNYTHNVIWDNLFPKWQKRKERIPDYPVQNEKHDLHGVLEKVRDALVQHKFKFEYFFEQFDPNRRFVFDRRTFIQAMVNTYDFPLTLKEYNILMDGFCDLDDKDKIYYKDFLRVVYEAEYFRDLEKNPLLFPLPHVANRFRREFKYGKQEMDAFREMWRKICLKMRGFREWEQAKGALIPTDSKKCKTHVLPENYRRILSLLDIEHLLTDYEVELLYDAYKIDVGREVRWDLEYFLRSADQMYLNTYNLH